MATYGSFNNCGLFVAGYDLKGESNMVRLEAIKEVKDRTTFGNLGRVRTLGGLADVSLTAAGFHSANQDQQFRANWGDNDICASLFLPATSGAAVAVGDLAWFFKACQPKYDTGGGIGDDLLWGLSLQGGDSGFPLCFGRVLNPGITPVTADGNGTGYQVGAVGSGQYAYAILHVTEVSAGDSIVVTIQSASDAVFTSPTTRFTFSSFSAIGAQFATRVAGPIVDTYWRCVYDVTGSGVSIKLACALAIQ